MAGRGTDIVLGGSLDTEIAQLEADTGAPVDDATRARLKAEWQERHEAVKAAGGLHIVGTERHESRRIDNQLRGRSGRQGDPGSSRFYLSLEDNLMRIFAADWVQKVMARMGLKEDDIIESPLVSKQIANAQRKVIYEQRNELLEAEDIRDNIEGIRGDVVAETVYRYVPPNSIDEQWDLKGLESELAAQFGVRPALSEMVAASKEIDAEQIAEEVQREVAEVFTTKEQQVGSDTMRAVEKHVMLSVLDDAWKQHLARMDYLRQGIGLRGYAQKQP
jgi:preprotein translocase subunit SecA